MSRRRTSPDGLPYRVYERRGTMRYSIGYKGADGSWVFRLRCAVSDKRQIAELRREAIARSAQLQAGRPSENSVAALLDAWVARQEMLPPGSEDRRADSTLAENKREIKNLKNAFGHMLVDTLQKRDAYEYLDACAVAVDERGQPRPRRAKGNKEISLMCTILEYGIRLGMLETNPFENVRKLVVKRYDRLVTQSELDLAIEVGERMGGPQRIVALALKTAWLCVRRSVEVRSLTASQITDAGIVWAAAKRKARDAKLEALIEWSQELRETLDAAMVIERNRGAGDWYVFGNMSGLRYTKGGWKATLAKLMRACVVEADMRGTPFKPFSLQDCRPKAITDKLTQGDEDVMDASLHTSEKMIQQTYDRRRRRSAKPVR